MTATVVNALADLSAYGVAFVSLRDNLDLSTPSGRLMFQIIGAMAECERALIQERVRAGFLLPALSALSENTCFWNDEDSLGRTKWINDLRSEMNDGFRNSTKSPAKRRQRM